MEPVSQNVRLVRRAYWLIRLRWLAIAGVVMAIFLADRLVACPVSRLAREALNEFKAA